jgi:hypothetical protein
MSVTIVCLTHYVKSYIIVTALDAGRVLVSPAKGCPIITSVRLYEAMAM